MTPPGDHVKEQIQRLRQGARESVRSYGLALGVGPEMVEALVLAVGDISVDEAKSALDHAAKASGAVKRAKAPKPRKKR